MAKVCELENRGLRKFVIGLEEHVSGGKVNLDANQRPMNVTIMPGATVKVSEACATKLTKGWKSEIRLIRTVKAKEK